MELKPKIEKDNEHLESYTDFKKRYYIYRVDDIVEYIQRDDSKLDKLFKQEKELFNNLKCTLTPQQQNLLSKYSDNWMYLLNEEVEELTQYILNDFEQEKYKK